MSLLYVVAAIICAVAASAVAPHLIRRSTIRLVRRTQQEIPKRFPATEAQQRIAALDDLIRALEGRRR